MTVPEAEADGCTLHAHSSYGQHNRDNGGEFRTQERPSGTLFRDDHVPERDLSVSGGPSEVVRDVRADRGHHRALRVGADDDRGRSGGSARQPDHPDAEPRLRSQRRAVRADAVAEQDTHPIRLPRGSSSGRRSSPWSSRGFCSRCSTPRSGRGTFKQLFSVSGTLRGDFDTGPDLHRTHQPNPRSRGQQDQSRRSCCR